MQIKRERCRERDRKMEKQMYYTSEREERETEKMKAVRATERH